MGHEGLWKFQRVGSLDKNRLIIRINNNRCVKDKVDHLNWVLDVPHRNRIEAKDWHASNSRPFRDPNSLYTMVSKPNQQQLLGC